MPRSFCLTGWSNGTGHFGLPTVCNRRTSRNRSGLRPHQSIVLANFFRVKVGRDRSLDEASGRCPVAARPTSKIPRRAPPKRYDAQSGTAALCVRPSAAPLACCAHCPCSSPTPQPDGTECTPDTPFLENGAAPNPREHIPLRTARCRCAQRRPLKASVPTLPRQRCRPSGFPSRNPRGVRLFFVGGPERVQGVVRAA